MYKTPEYIVITRSEQNRIEFFQCEKVFENATVFCQAKHMTKQDAVDWCHREHWGVPVYHQ